MSPRHYQPDESNPAGATAPGLAKPGPAFEATPSIVDGPTRYQLPELAPSFVELAVGQAIGQRYEVLWRIGAGGMGEVWKALDSQLDRVVAIKRITPELAGEKALLERFFQEAKAVAALNHPHIVQIFDRGSDRTGEFFVMEFVDGPSLSRLLAEQGAFDLERTVRIGQAICDALQAAHDKGILHRDVKPGNILWGAAQVPKLTDFGLARHESAAEHSLTKGAIGTPLYMSPEQHESASSVTGASDQWSLGATLYHLVTGQPPRVMRENRLAVPLREILMRAVDDDPAERFSNMRQFGEALAAILAPTRRRPTSSVGGTDLASIVQAMQTRVNEAHTEAQRLIEEDHDYATAVEVLSEVPEHLRKGGLLRLATTRRDRVTELDREIEQRSRELRLPGLPPLIRELLDLQPQRDDLRQFFETVQAATPAVAVSASRPALLKAPFGTPEITEARNAWSKFLGQPIELTNSIGMKLILIPPGEFLMGSTDADVAVAIKAGCYAYEPSPLPYGPELDAIFRKFGLLTHKLAGEQPPHRVRLTQPFYAGIYPVTQREWQAVTSTNPSHFKGERRPVEQVNWSEMEEFARDLSLRSEEATLGRIYRLPSEAEWEYFCRAGTATPFWFGSELNGEQLNVDHNNPDGTSEGWPSLQQTSDVGKYAANPFGLFDVHGNVLEWCGDQYGEGYYKSSPEEDPPGPSSGEDPPGPSGRVLRGGSWNQNWGYARSAFRIGIESDVRLCNIGGRVVFPALRQDS